MNKTKLYWENGTAIEFQLCTEEGIDTRTLITLFQNAGLSTHASNPNASYQSHLLLFARDPVSVLAKDIIENKNPDESLQSWIKRLAPVLEAFRSNRPDALLVNIDNALIEPEQLGDALHSRFNVKLGVISPDAGTTISAMDPIHALLADYLLRHNNHSRLMLAELEANFVNFVGKSVSVTDVMKTIDALHSKLETDQTELREENELLLLQLAESQEQIDIQNSQHYDAKARIRDQRHEIETLKNEKETLKNRLQEAVEEVASLTEQLHDIARSKSWRLTAPLRSAFDLVGRRSNEP